MTKIITLQQRVQKNAALIKDSILKRSYKIKERLYIEAKYLSEYGFGIGQPFVDVDRKIVLFATIVKGKDTLERFRTHLTSKGVAAQQIEEVCCDMSAAFIRGVEEYFPDAETLVWAS